MRVRMNLNSFALSGRANTVLYNGQHNEILNVPAHRAGGVSVCQIPDRPGRYGTGHP